MGPKHPPVSSGWGASVCRGMCISVSVFRGGVVSNWVTLLQHPATMSVHGPTRSDTHIYLTYSVFLSTRATFGLKYKMHSLIFPDSLKLKVTDVTLILWGDRGSRVKKERKTSFLCFSSMFLLSLYISPSSLSHSWPAGVSHSAPLACLNC